LSEVAIRLEGVSKKFKLYADPITGPVKELAFFWKRQRYYKEFEAVKDASLEVKRGEVVGIIGPNGAGKTTLLKMIAGLLPVDKGHIEVNGKVTALLALGVGVHPEFSGRDNILFGGMLLGMAKAEVKRKMPAIIEFAELGEFIDQPFRTYSSGMKARLLFSIAMSIDPDILIVDEALATGDAYFVQKSSERIRHMCRSGATIVFVSHNLRQIEALCERCYFMADGRILSEGSPAAAVAGYHQWAIQKGKERTLAAGMPNFPGQPVSNGLEIIDFQVLDASGQPADMFHTGDPVRLIARYLNTGKHPTAHFNIGFYNYRTREYVAHANTFYRIPQQENLPLKLGAQGLIEITLPAVLLTNGGYYMELLGVSADRSEVICRYRPVAPFYVAKRYNPLTQDVYFMQPAVFQSKEET
jgi:ABC-type polysaccharide/polyol phosphate transport system ATPase subunit